MRRIAHMTAALIVATAAFALSWRPAAAQSWPQRPVHFILPLSPGSAVDINARLLAGKLAEIWGQPIVVENKPGGDTMVAIGAFTRANDDHTLYYAPSGSFIMHPFIYEKLPYNAETDLLPIVRVSKTIVGVFAPSGARETSLAEMVASARARPGQLNWTGSNNIADFVFQGFLQTSGLDMTHVPYRDLMLGLADVAEGRVQIGVMGLATARPMIDAGKVKVLAVVTHERAPSMPEMPTVTELGFPGLTIDGLVGVFGPKGMPMALREKIAADIGKVVASPEITKQLVDSGQIVDVGGPAAFAAAIAEQRVIAADIAARGVKPFQ